MSQETVRRRPVNSANLEARRKAIRRKKMKQKRFLLLGMLLAAIIIIVLIIVGIVSLIKGRFHDTTTLVIDADGTVTMDEVDDFSESNYDKSDMNSYIEDLVKEYNDSGKGGKVKLKKTKVKDDKAYVRMQYSDYNAYQNFTNNELFVGTVGEAKAKGYSFEDTFSTVKDKSKGEAVTVEDMTSDDNKKVVIVRGNENIIVPGKITAVSDPNTTIVDKDEISVTQPDGNKDATTLTIIMYE